MQKALDPLSVERTRTLPASYVLRRRYGPVRHIIAVASWVTVINMLLQPVAVLAATISWDGDNSTAWATGANWTDGTAPVNDLTTDIANFNLVGPYQAAATPRHPTSGSININGVTIGAVNGAMTLTTGTTPGLSIGASGITIAANAGVLSVPAASVVTIGANQNWVNNSANVPTFGAIALGVNKLTLAGGDFIFSGANTGTAGSIDLNAGNLCATVAAAFGPAANTLNFGGGNLELRAAATTFTGKIDMTVAGTTITINPAATGNGVTHIISGAATLGGGQTLVMSPGALSTASTYGLTLSGTSTLSGNAIFQINNNNGGGLGTLTVGAITGGTGNSITLKGAGKFAQTAAWTVTSGGSLVLDSTYSGTATLSQANTFTGGVTINTTAGGIVTVTGVTGLGPAADATVTFGANSTGKLQVQQAVTIVGLDTNVTPGSPIVENGSGTSRILTVNNTSNSTFAGVIQNGGGAGTLGLTKSGVGTFTLSGDNTYTGNSTVSAGTLILSGNNVGAITGTTTISGGVLQYNSLASINGTARNVTVTSPGVAAFGPAFGANIQTALTTRIVNTSTGMIAFMASNSETLDLSAAGANLTAAYLGTLDTTGNVIYSGTLTPNATAGYRLGGGGGTFTVSSALTGATALTANGGAPASSASVLILDGNLSTYTGAITVSNGRLRFGPNATLPAAGLSQSALALANTAGVAYDMEGKDVVIGSLGTGGSTGGVLENVPGTLRLGGTTGSFAGVIANTWSNTGTLAFEKSGAGTQTLTGNNTYTGSTTISGGTLTLGTAGVDGKLSGTSSVTIGGKGTLSYANGVSDRINTFATLTLGGDVGGYTKNGAGTLSMNYPAALATYSQTLASLTVRPGSNRIDPAGTAAGTLNLIFTGTGGAGYQRETGGLVNITTPSVNWVPSWANAPTLAGTSEVSGTSADAILVGAFHALTRGTGDFVKADTSFSAASYTDVVYTDDPDAWTSGKNIRMTTGGTTPRLDIDLSVNSLMSGTAALTTSGNQVIPILTGKTLTIDSGMVYARNGSITLGNGADLGNIASGNGQDLVLIVGRQGSADLSVTVNSTITGNPALTVNCGVNLTNGANAIGDIYLHGYYTSNNITFDSRAQGALGQSGTDRTIYFLGNPTTDFIGGSVGTLLKISTVAQTYDSSLKFHFGGEVGFVPIIQVDTYAEFQGKLSGHNGFQKTGAGLLRLTNTANDFAGNVDVNAGALAVSSMNVLPATGNLNVNGGVLVLDGRNNGNDVIKPGDLPTYGTGAGQWQFTSGGFAARGANITIGSTGIGANFNFDKNFTLGSTVRDADGNYFANAGVDIAQNTSMTGTRTITLGGTGPGLTGAAGSGVVNEISGNISGSGAPSIPSTVSGSIGEIVISGTSSWTGSPDASAGAGGIATLGPNGTIGSFIRFNDQASLPNGNGGGATPAQIVAVVTANNGSNPGILFTGNGGAGTIYTPNANYRFLIGTTDGGNDRTATLGSTGGAATLSTSTILLSSGSATGTKTTTLLVRDGTFILGDGNGAVTFVATSKVTNILPTDTLSTLASTTGARILTKVNIGTVALGSVAYLNTTGGGTADYSSSFTYNIGSATAGVFGGAIRETATSNTGVSNQQTLALVKTKIQGGVLEFGATPRAITLGTAAGQIDMSGTGGGGFSVWDSTTGTTRNIDIGPGTSLVWVGTGRQAQWVADGAPLIFGSTTANGTANLQNNISLTGSTTGRIQYIASVRGVGTGPEGQLNGILSNSVAANLVFTGMVKPDGTPLAAGSLLLSNASNSYTGTTTIQSGTVLAGGDAPGVAGNGVFGNATSAILLGGTRTTQTSVRAASTADFGTPTGSSGSYVFDLAWQAIDGVTLSADDRVLCKDGGGSENGIYVVSAVNGMMRLTQQGTTTLNDQVQVTYGVVAAGRTYYGSAANTWSLDTDPNVGLLTNGAYTIGRNITVGGSTLGTATIGGNTDNTSTFSGTVTLNRNLRLSQVANTGVNKLVVSGLIDDGAGGSFGVTKVGAGVVELARAAGNTYDGGTTVSAGTLLVNNTSNSGTGTGAVNVSSTGILGGTGTIGGAVTINSGGTLKPGTDGTGTLNVGALTMNGILELNSNDGTVCGKIVSTGAVSLSGTLTLNLTGTPTETEYVVVSGTELTGTFSNYANNASVSWGGKSYKLTYTVDAVKLVVAPGGTVIMFR